MDTPERSKAGTPISKFEDSPVFNFLNSLSPIGPIQPVKPSHSLQTFPSLNFASLQSVFASPHAVQLRDSRFLLRQSFPSSSKNDNSSVDRRDDIEVSMEKSGDADTSSCPLICSSHEGAIAVDDYTGSTASLSEAVRFESSSPNHSTTPRFIMKPDFNLDLDYTPVELVHSVLDGAGRRKCSFVARMELQEKHNLVENENEAAGCAWESLVAGEANNLLAFESSCQMEHLNGSDEKPGNSDLRPLSSFLPKLGENVVESSQRLTFEDVLPCSQPETYFPFVGHDDMCIDQDAHGQIPHYLEVNCQNHPSNSNVNSEADQTNGISTACLIDVAQQRGIRRRCLVFEGSGASKKKPQNELDLHPGIRLEPAGQGASVGTQAVSSNPDSSRLPCMLPCIGLHLNALATTSMTSGRKLGRLQSINLLPPVKDEQTQSKSISVEKDIGFDGSEIQELNIADDDASMEPGLSTCNDNSSSPKRKRRKSEGDDGDACKRCSCKKSKCLKLYCECFAAGIYCVETCSCIGCLNKPIHEETVMSTRKQIESRNPLAFAPKVILAEKSQDTGQEYDKVPASARHKRGCNCKKSSCLKKYCECYQGGVGCSVSCRCESCKNIFGTKDGTLPIEDEKVEHEEQRSAEGEKDESQNAESALPIINPSSKTSRQPANRRPASAGKPPRSSVATASRLNTTKSLAKCEARIPKCKPEKRVETRPEDDNGVPEILINTASPSNVVKNASPNQKRVSPPHNAAKSTPPLRKGARKLILNSVPPFPSLNSSPTDEHPSSCANGSADPPGLIQG